jgi:hypothetical protein
MEMFCVLKLTFEEPSYGPPVYASKCKQQKLFADYADSSGLSNTLQPGFTLLNHSI